MSGETMRQVSQVAELQGLYGAFTFPEKLLQKIWLRGDFRRAELRTLDGRTVRVVQPGKWNLLGGPDFTGARLRFADGAETTGDVELHLRAADWDAHRHAADPAYDRVILHVVLFPPERAYSAGAGGGIPIVALLPLLHRALEEYAADDAVENLSHRAAARLPDELGTLPPAEVTTVLRRGAEARWEQKRRFAAIRIERLGWAEACHQTALEILGYRFNRAPMLRVAGAWRLSAWTAGNVDVARVWAEESAAWSVQGVRPANHPRARLAQYAAWTRAQPGWPDRLEATLGGAGMGAAAEMPTSEFRRRAGLAALRERVAEAVCGGAVSGSRLDTLICDGLLALVAAQTGAALAPVWYHWFPGDLPGVVTGGLRQLGYFNGRAQPACHGVAQGLLSWLLARETQT
jgi:hypothetical protein